MAVDAQHSTITLTDVGHHNHRETDENAQTDSAFVPTPPLPSIPRSSMGGESLTGSGFPDSNQDLPLLHWTSDGLSSPVQPPSLTKHSARRTPGVFPTTSASHNDHRSPTEDDLGHWDTHWPPVGAGRGNPLSQWPPVTYDQQERFGNDSTHEDANPTDHSGTNGPSHNGGSIGVALGESMEMEIDDLLEVVMDYPSKRTTMTSVPLLPLPEEVAISDGPPDSQPHINPSLPSLLAANVPPSGDSDTSSLASSSPGSSKGSKRSFTPITPSTDGWRSPPTPATVPERETIPSDHFGYLEAPGRPEPHHHDPRQVPEDTTRDRYPSSSSEGRRAHHNRLPPLVVTIPQDSTIRRRPKNSISSEQTVTHDRIRRVESPTDHSMSSRFSDDEVSEITQTEHTSPRFEVTYFPTSGPASALVTRPRPRIEIPTRVGSDSFNSERSPNSGVGIGPSPLEYPSPSHHGYTPSPKRGVFRSLFLQNGRAASEQKKEGKRAKTRDQIRTQSPDTLSMDSASIATSSSKSSKGKDRDEKKAAKAAKRAQLAVQLRTKQLQQATEKDPDTTSHATRSRKGWEESGAMYSLGGIL